MPAIDPRIIPTQRIAPRRRTVVPDDGSTGLSVENARALIIAWLTLGSIGAENRAVDRDPRLIDPDEDTVRMGDALIGQRTL